MSGLSAAVLIKGFALSFGLIMVAIAGTLAAGRLMHS